MEGWCLGRICSFSFLFFNFLFFFDNQLVDTFAGVLRLHVSWRITIRHDCVNKLCTTSRWTARTTKHVNSAHSIVFRFDEQMPPSLNQDNQRQSQWAGTNAELHDVQVAKLSADHRAHTSIHCTLFNIHLSNHYLKLCRWKLYFFAWWTWLRWMCRCVIL